MTGSVVSQAPDRLIPWEFFHTDLRRISAPSGIFLGGAAAGAAQDEDIWPIRPLAASHALRISFFSWNPMSGNSVASSNSSLRSSSRGHAAARSVGVITPFFWQNSLNRAETVLSSKIASRSWDKDFASFADHDLAMMIKEESWRGSKRLGLRVQKPKYCGYNTCDHAHMSKATTAGSACNVEQCRIQPKDNKNMRDQHNEQVSTM